MFNWSTLQYKLRYSYARVIPALYRAGFRDRAKKISECGHYKELAICKNCGETYLNGFNTCKDRFCPVCEKKRSYLWLSKLQPLIKQYLDEGKFVKMITLTIKNGPILKTQLDILTKCWRVLVHDDKTLRKEFKSRYIGGFKALEVKRGKGQKLWHAHYHLLVVSEKAQRDVNFIRNSWNKAYKLVTGNEVSLQTRVDSIKSNGKEEIGAILEVAKYVTKFDWEFTDDVQELLTELHGVKIVSTWGLLRKSLTEQSVERDMNKTLKETINLVCKVCGNDTFDFVEGVEANNINVSDYMEDELTELDKMKDRDLEFL